MSEKLRSNPGRGSRPVAPILVVNGVQETTPAVLVHHSRAPVVQTPGTLVVSSHAALVRLGCVRHFEPGEHLLVVAGQTGERRVAGAVFENCHQDTASLRIESDWHSFDQRRSRRYNCDLSARVVTSSGLWEAVATVVNISDGGLAFTCRELPPVPDLVVVLSGDDHLSLPCRVVSRRQIENRSVLIGAKFVTLGLGEPDPNAEAAQTSALRLATGVTAVQAPLPPEPRIIGGRQRR